MERPTELFSSDNAVTGTAARREIHHLAQLSSRVDVMRHEGDEVVPCRVIDIVPRTHGTQIEIDQPIGRSSASLFYAVGEELVLYWSDDGMRYGACAVVAEVVQTEAKPSYFLKIDDTIYREQDQRGTDRIVIEESDGLDATLTSGARRKRLAPTVKDISSSGIRLSLPIREINAADIEPRINVTLALSFPGVSEWVRTHATIAWLEQINEQAADFGCAWRHPPDAFIDALERFVADKTPGDDST